MQHLMQPEESNYGRQEIFRVDAERQGHCSSVPQQAAQGSSPEGSIQGCHRHSPKGEGDK